MMSSAWAQAQATPAPGNPWMQFVPLILIFFVFYFLMVRPSVKRQKVHQQMLKALKIGDTIVTSAGLIGVVKAMTDKIVTVEVAEAVRVKILRGQVGQVVTGSLEDVRESTT